MFLLSCQLCFQFAIIINNIIFFIASLLSLLNVFYPTQPRGAPASYSMGNRDEDHVIESKDDQSVKIVHI
jgi:hypothetical protein